ncbi:MAG: FkbM family methyltransferase [Betaproteobacteria bacterium]
MSVRLLGVLALALLVACGRAPAPGAQNPNAVDAALLRPLLLDDAAQMSAYLSALPEAVYKVYEVAGVGKFHLDEVRDLIKDRLRRGEVWEADLQRLFSQHVKPDSTVIDAGAHIGAHTVVLARHAGPAGRVYAFEPQKKLYRELVFNLRLNGAANAVPLRFALGRGAGVIEMSPTVAGNEGSTGVGAGGDRAELRSVDSFGFRQVSFMKIDVEGFEDEVLEGARLTIARFRPAILIEIQGGHWFHESAPPEIRAKVAHTKKLLEGMGYKVDRLRGYDYLALPL